jgi:hypothetical protein
LFEIIAHIVALIVYVLVGIKSFVMVKKLYGGVYSNALPYFVLGIFSMLGLIILDQVDIVFAVLNTSDVWAHSVQALQLVSGLFFIKALYEVYKVRYAISGFIDMKEAKSGGKGNGRK